MHSHGYVIGNIDALIMIEEPKCIPYLDIMKDNIALELNCLTTQINLKATRGEGLGFVGRKEGVMAQAVCLLFKEEKH